ncbi:hypothetical protein BKA65DRAFT_510932 [Rhexocercosporidium sp. MPI-PUGE-AT-0058]|nr:hypothetical protein BKA65DRAFT_510932 [Rhexocercosporidium sp. MPI-PUGE-AT-0058]
MEQSSASRAPLKILSLDGGGIRGLSELYILDVIMHRVQLAGNLTAVPLPADYFDIIGGTSTGGLIAILLGRLRLSVPQAIEKYGELSKHVFSQQKRTWQDGKFKASRLEGAIRKVLIDTLGVGRDEERMRGESLGFCKTFVCAVPAHQVNSGARLFRSYLSKDPCYNPTIWEAARATSAAPGFFKRISIGEPGVQEDFVDGALGYNNPVELAIQEAIHEFDPEMKLACIVSIGTGKTRLAGFKRPGLLQRVIPVDLIKTLATMATSSEAASKILEERYRNCPGLYHRLNVEKGLTEIALGEWERLSEVKTHTLAYLNLPEVDARINVIVNCLLGRPVPTYRLGALDGSFRAATPPSSLPTTSNLVDRSENSVIVMYPSFGVTHFVHRAGPLDELERHFDKGETSNDPKVIVLQGMGGCGKSQLALKYCKRAHLGQEYEMIFWIDATSPETAMQSFTKVAEALLKPGFQAAEVEANLQFVRMTLNSKTGRWLLVFDNFDYPEIFRTKRLKEYFPSVGPGSILITSRQVEVRALGHHSLEVNQLSEPEALEILLHRTGRESSEENRIEASKITKRLGYHALAVDQAGAYMWKRGMEFAAYLECYDRQREKVLNEAPEIWDYTKASKDSAEGQVNCTVFATMELSLKSLSGNGATRRDKRHILTLMAFFDINKLADTLFTPAGLESGNWTESCRENDAWSTDAFLSILTELRNLSLLQSLNTASTETTFSIHPLVQDWLKARIGIERGKEYLQESMLVLSKYIWTYDVINDFPDADFNTKQFMLAHVDATILAKQEYYQSWSFITGKGLLWAGYAYYSVLGSHGRDRQAEELCRAVLEERANENGEEHPDTLADMHNLSNYLRFQGKYEEAESLIRQCVAIKVKLRGKEALETLQSMNSLTNLLESQGKFDDADEMSQEAVEISARVFGKEHIQTIFSVQNRASVLKRMKNYGEAERLNRENLIICKKLLGIQHPQTLNILNNLALCLDDGGKFEEAETFLRESLRLTEDVFGPQHPDTLSSICNLAVNLYQQRKLPEAEELFWRAYPGHESVFGWQHPNSLAFLAWMAECLRGAGKDKEAEEIRELYWVSKRAREEQLEASRSRVSGTT